MAAKELTYLVQCWTSDGKGQEHYEVLIGSQRELTELKQFLKEKYAHVLVTRQPPRPRGR